MPVIKLSLTEDEFKDLSRLADGEKMSIQDFIRYKLLAKKNPSIFLPEVAEKLALEKFTSDDGVFTLPDVFGEDWSELNPRMTGVFGKRFFNYVKTSDAIEFAGMTPDGRRATYRVKGDNSL